MYEYNTISGSYWQYGPENITFYAKENRLGFPLYFREACQQD